MRTKGSWLALGTYALLTIALSWPLVTALGSRIPGTATWAFDESTFAWNLWYFKHALLDLGRSPLHTELIWYPLGMDLTLYTFNFFNALVGLPLLLATNVPTTINLTLLVGTTLSGFGAYLLALDALRHTGAGRMNGGTIRLAAFVAGVIYAFASHRAVYMALGHYNIATTQWIPFYALYLTRVIRRPTVRDGALAGLFFALAALAEMTFAALLGLFTLVILIGSWGRIADRRGIFRALAVTAIVAFLLWSPVLIPVAREFARQDAQPGWGEAVKLSADLVGLMIPTDLNPLFTDHAADLMHWSQALRLVEEGKGRFSDINTVFLGWVTLALALLGLWAARGRARAWGWTALIFGVLALGPLFQISGRYRFSLDGMLPEGVTIPLPFTLLHFVPVINANRTPNRNTVILMLALAVLASFGVAWLLQQIAVRSSRFQVPGSQSSTAETQSPIPDTRSQVTAATALVTLVLAGAIIAEHLAIPLPATDARIPSVYRQIAAEPGDFGVMQLPLGWRDSYGALGSELTLLQYFQTAHGKPMLGGNTSRAPAYKMDYFRRIPLFAALTDLELYREPTPEVDAAARTQAADLMALYDVRYLVTSPPIPGRYPYQDTWERTEAYALDILPVEQPPVWEADGYRAYRIKQPEIPFPFRADVGVAGAEPYLGRGWDVRTDEQPYSATANWITGRSGDLYLPLSKPRDATLRLSLAPFDYDDAPGQSVSINVNGTPVLQDQALQSGWQTIEARVPASATRRGPNRISLIFRQAASPRAVSADPMARAIIGATGVVSPVNVEAHAFDEAFITVMDEDGLVTDASAGKRGYNVAVIHPRTGRVIDVEGFDLAAGAAQDEALAAFLSGLRPGVIVALATKGDNSVMLSQVAVDALRSIGSRVLSPAELSGQSHALVGVAGAAPGAAAEQIAPGDAFLRVGGDFRQLSAAVDWAEIGP